MSANFSMFQRTVLACTFANTLRLPKQWWVGWPKRCATMLRCTINSCELNIWVSCVYHALIMRLTVRSSSWSIKQILVKYFTFRQLLPTYLRGSFQSLSTWTLTASWRGRKSCSLSGEVWEMSEACRQCRQCSQQRLLTGRSHGAKD